MNRREFLRRSMVIGCALGLPGVQVGKAGAVAETGLASASLDSWMLSREARMVFGRAVYAEMMQKQSFGSLLMRAHSEQT